MCPMIDIAASCPVSWNAQPWFFVTLKIYSIEKNKYELEIHYLLNNNQIYYQDIETFLEKIIVEIEDSKPYNENIIDTTYCIMEIIYVLYIYYYTMKILFIMFQE